MRISQVGATISVAAPAKINLFLEILARRTDGFHELETVMVAVSIYDTVELTATDDGSLELACRTAFPAEMAGGTGRGLASGLFSRLPTDSENLVWRALELLRDVAKVTCGARVRLTKRIPLEAGMGGGSSDAAAALLAANRLWRLNWELDRLLPLAERLGSDVPFFMEKGPAICRGRGERIERLDMPLGLPLVVAHPGRGLSTAEVYGTCELAEAPVSARPLVDAWRRGSRAAMGRTMANRLEGAAMRLESAVADLRNDIRQWVGHGYQMTGSGAACFGLCPSLRHARRTAMWLRARGWPFAAAVRMVA